MNIVNCLLPAFKTLIYDHRPQSQQVRIGSRTSGGGSYVGETWTFGGIPLTDKMTGRKKGLHNILSVRKSVSYFIGFGFFCY